VLDVSRNGMRLAVASAFGLPPVFDLRAGGHRYHLRVKRRGRGELGTEFA
jgi:hypothetical protein